MTSDQYNTVGQKLDEAGIWPPAGLLAHVCFDAGGGLHVSEVWESREQQHVRRSKQRERRLVAPRLRATSTSDVVVAALIAE